MNVLSFDSVKRRLRHNGPAKSQRSRYDPETSDTPLSFGTPSWTNLLAEEISATLKEIAGEFQREARLSGLSAPGLITAANVLHDRANEAFSSSMRDVDHSQDNDQSS